MSDPHSPRNSHGTPNSFFSMIDAEFDFNVDAAATHANKKCYLLFGPDHILPELRDSLKVDWKAYCAKFDMQPNIWLNPPYGRGLIAPFLVKAKEEARKGCTVVVLLPCSPETRWWRNHVYDGASEVRIVKRRIKFLGSNGAKFPSALVIYRPSGVNDVYPPRMIYQTYPK